MGCVSSKGKQGAEAISDGTRLGAPPKPTPQELPAGSFDPSLYRARVVAFGLPAGGFEMAIGAAAPYFTSGDAVMPEGVFKEIFLTTADETMQFIVLLFEAKAEEAIKAQYGATPEDEAWKAMEAGAKEYGMMADPVKFTYLDGSALFGGATSYAIPEPGSAMPAVAGWPADLPTVEGAIVQTDAPVNAQGAYEGVKIAPKYAASRKTAAIEEAAGQKQAAAVSAASVWRKLVDMNNDGSIDRDELHRLFEKTDENKDGKLTVDELSTAVEDRLGAEGARVLAQQLVSACDDDSDGAISRKELFDFFANEEDVKKAIAKAEKVEAEMKYS